MIKLLDKSVYNRIAAGEVVERPACILRELLDNAIDAGADQIETCISFDDGYTIEVKDNGCGMSEDDLKLAFNSHATSKINDFIDIYHTASLGFRGEALSAIASVSLVECISSDNDRGQACSVFLEGGKIKSSQTDQAGKGTLIRIKDLFYNTPVRRKFLKSAAAEKTALKKEFILHALANTGTAFKLIFVKNSKKDTVFDIPANFSFKDRIDYLYGPRISSSLLTVTAAADSFHLHGYVTSQRFRNRTKREQFFIIKKRVAANTTLSAALNNSYNGILPPGFFPACFLFFQTDDELVDINVHPAKKEVKLQNSTEAYRFIYHTLRQTVY
ncbi:MAG TPA: DNA mismatch repair endonuclease MutL, partial [Spirochaetota bacterium]|nr:DNA mismatch repair endonuclease MutL [Spirochaetota bacterium]